MSEHLSMRRCAALLGISHVALRKAAETGRAPQTADGRFDLDEVKASQWWRAKQAASAVMEEHPAPSSAQQSRVSQVSKADLDKLLALERREKLRIENDREKKNTVRVSDAVVAWSIAGRKISSAVLGIPNRVLNQLPAEWRQGVSAVLEAEIRNTLESLAHELERHPTTA